MQVVLIGSGNIATLFAREWSQNGVKIIQVYSRDINNAKALASVYQAPYTNIIADIIDSADLYLMALKDDAIIDFAANFSLKDKIVLHTAGSLSVNVLQNCSTNFGVLWPMKMIRKEMQSLVPLNIIIDANNAETLEKIKQMALLLSNNIIVANDDYRLKMHLMASFTANFSNHLYLLAKKYCDKQELDFGLLYPIILETAKQIKDQDPANLQAGPAYRNDQNTIKKHQELLEDEPLMLHFYQLFTKSIVQSASDKAI
jgi:predicted short-subunit dehydrogenase-like oxidoreductase (DUF2520 family)